MRSVRSELVIGLIAQLALLAGLARLVGLGAPGWVVGIGFGVVTCTLLARALPRSGALSPGSRVTLGRATLVGAVAALTADSHGRPAPVAALVGLAVVALALDAVDGWVARRTGTGSGLGARFDEEVDASLILVLSWYVGRSAGWWVLTLGVAHYAFVVARRSLPWLREPLPPRYWSKVVAAILGVTLTVAAADVLPRSATDAALTICLVLLVESFGRDIRWLWRHRHVETGRVLVAVGRGQSVL